MECQIQGLSHPLAKVENLQKGLMKRSWLIVTGCCLVHLGISQANYGGFFPETGITKVLTQNWTLKLKIESQHGLLETVPEESDHFEYFHDRTDLQGFVGYGLINGAKIAIGYQYRLQQGRDNHRSIQQISWSNSLSDIQLGHRIRADQTFENAVSNQYRLRYRFTFQRNFSGSMIYLLLSDELIYAYQSRSSSWENRLVIALGLNLPDGSRLQIGPDYRLDADFHEEVRTRLWLKVGWFKRF
jgi:hypothetical protein